MVVACMSVVLIAAQLRIPSPVLITGQIAGVLPPSLCICLLLLAHICCFVVGMPWWFLLGTGTISRAGPSVA